MPQGRRWLGPKRLIFLASLIAGVLLLGVILRYVDLHQALRELRRVGWEGCLGFLANIALTIGGPLVGWHLLMRSVGIPVAFRTSVSSTLMGWACNMVSPMSYFGGEGIRTYHIAARTGVPKREVLATIVVSEFQHLAGLTLLVLISVGIAAGTSALSGPRLAWAAAGGVGVALFLVLILCLSLGEVRLSVRILDLLIRWGIFPRRLGALRDSARDLEQLVRSQFVTRRRVFVVSGLASLLSPLCQFIRPTLFFWFLRGRGAGPDLPSLSQLAVFFLGSQLLFMLPTTPAGIGVYEGGLIGMFRFLGWETYDAAAYSLLVRLDDLVYLLFGWGLIVHFGMSRMVGEEPPEPPGPPPPAGPAAPSAVSGDVPVKG